MANIAVGTIGVSSAAIPLSTVDTPCFDALVQSDPDNVQDIYVGNSTAQSLQITPGQSVRIPISHVRLVYARTATSTGTVNWIVSI